MVIHTDRLQNSNDMYRDFKKVQDSYSIRCIPQVHGPVFDTLRNAERILKIEINSATDNPLIFLRNDYFNKSFGGGNFHGEYLSLSMDNLGNAIEILSNISERRIFKLVTRALNEGLPGFLIQTDQRKSGLMNGAMILQYTAAHLVSENKTLSYPASVDSIPSSEDKEDFVSMAPIAASKTLAIIDNTESVLAIELWCDVMALRLRVKEGLKPSDNAQKIMELSETKMPPFDEDRVIYDEIRSLKEFIHSGEFIRLIEGSK
jgi:histidine ammonia-lyase